MESNYRSIVLNSGIASFSI